MVGRVDEHITTLCGENPFMNIKLVVFLLFLSIFGCEKHHPTYQHPRQSEKIFIQQSSAPLQKPIDQRWTAYHRMIQATEKTRQSFFARYASAKAHNRERILEEAATYLAHQLLYRFIPAWYGIPWKFVGNREIEETEQQYQARKNMVLTSQRIENPYEPGVTTNCSLLLSTTLKHMGFQVERYRLSWQLSYDIIRTLTPPKNIVWLQNKPMEDFLTKTNIMGKGIFIVGLDYHTGYIVNGSPLSSTGTKLPRDVYFCHADYGQSPQMVRCELAKQSPVLTRSKVRVIGKIFSIDGNNSNPNLVKAWIMQKKIRTIGKYNH